MLLADRLRATSRPDAATSLDDTTALSEDELDEMIMDQVASAGDRFNRLLRSLGRQASAAGTRSIAASEIGSVG